jgi:putative transposase
MRSSRLKSGKKRLYTSTTDSRDTNRIARNRLNRCFTTSAPNEVWVTDVKAIRTHEGLLHLAAMTALFSRRVIGHAMSESNDTDLALHALNNAARVRGNIKGVIHHSNRGSPYRSQTYRKRLAQLHMRPSMSRTGDCWDNAVAESFFSTLEAE